HGHLPRVHTDDARDPSGGAVVRGDLHDGLGELGGVRLGAAILIGLEHADHDGFAKQLGGTVGELAELLVVGPLRGDLLSTLFDQVEDGVCHRRVPSNSSFVGGPGAGGHELVTRLPPCSRLARVRAMLTFPVSGPPPPHNLPMIGKPKGRMYAVSHLSAAPPLRAAAPWSAPGPLKWGRAR